MRSKIKLYVILKFTPKTGKKGESYMKVAVKLN